MYSNSIILLDNTNHHETIYVVKRFAQNKYTRKLKKFAMIFDFETNAIKDLNLGKFYVVVFIKFLGLVQGIYFEENKSLIDCYNNIFNMQTFV